MHDHRTEIDPALWPEIEECDKGYEIIRKTINRQPGYVVDWQLVDKAWETAKRLHCDPRNNPRRKSGELYIYHPRAVMEELARLRCKSSVLAAALLHDTMVDCSMAYEELREGFSYEVAGIVDAVTAIKSEEKAADPHYRSMTAAEKHEFLDRLTDAKLISSPFQREAFLVRLADREHNLSTIAACSTGKRLEKIASTRAFLIPAAQKLGIRYFEIILSDYCMKFEGEDYHSNRSVRILDQRNALVKVGGSAYSRFDQVLQEALEAQSVFALPTFNPFAKLRGGGREGGDHVRTTPRRVLLAHELWRQADEGGALERSRTDLWEVILSCRESESHDMLRRFLELYREHLKGEGLFFEYVGQEKEALVVRLTDSLENNYRVVLIPESRLESYFIGDPDGERLTMIDEEAPGDALRPQITVYSYSPKKGYRKYERCVPYGATALDFAFIISPALAVTVNSASIHQWDGGAQFRDDDYRYPLQTVLSDGDVVYFDADYYPRRPGGGDGRTSVPHATIDWFSHVNTERAKAALIRYFKAKYAD